MEPIIKVEHLSKEFGQKGSGVHALNDVSLSIEKGDIYGIIGMSGAGKSTFVRCLNLLERPTSGNVYIDGKDLVSLSERELRAERMNIGMIFQHFNLLMQRSVIDNVCFPLEIAGVKKKEARSKAMEYLKIVGLEEKIFQHFNLLMQRSVIDNVCFPLEIAGVKKKEARSKAMEYLKIVGLEEKANAYPSQLSGGQKQRVAIARVLASDPKILLCDEATSALDPQTTKAILQLLKEINQEYGITIVVITHEMAVVQEICSHVAVRRGDERARSADDKSDLTAFKRNQPGIRNHDCGDYA